MTEQISAEELAEYKRRSMATIEPPFLASALKIQQDCRTMIAAYEAKPPFTCAYESAHADNDGNCVQKFEDLKERTEKAEDRVRELEAGFDLMETALSQADDALRVANAQLLKARPLEARVVVLRGALANLVDEPAMPLSHIQAREALASIDPAADKLMRRLQLAEAVCRLEIAWQKHELGDCAPESIQPALDKWREATK